MKLGHVYENILKRVYIGEALQKYNIYVKQDNWEALFVIVKYNFGYNPIIALL